MLIIKIQPTEGVYLQFNIKRPGETDDIIPAKMDFCQNCNLIHHLNTPEAYERLLAACIRGERSGSPSGTRWRPAGISSAICCPFTARRNFPCTPMPGGRRGLPGWTRC